jgi:hypothetical protein
VSQGTERPEERERDSGTTGLWSSQDTQQLSIQFAVLYRRGSWGPETIAIVTPQITITGVMIMKELEILRELPKCDTET